MTRIADDYESIHKLMKDYKPQEADHVAEKYESLTEESHILFADPFTVSPVAEGYDYIGFDPAA